MSADNPDPNTWKNLLKHPKRGVPEGLWKRCPGCEATIFRKEAEKRLGVCPECDYHWYVSARERIRQLFDEGTFEEWDADLEPVDPLEFVDKIPYREKLSEEQKRTGLKDAAMTGTGMIRGRPRGLRRDRFGLHDGQHGLGGGREAHPRHERASAAPPAADHRLRFRRRRADARGHVLADADGQGLGRPGPLRSRPAGCSSPC